MPVIREYQQQTRAPGVVQRPQYSGDQFGAAEGRAIVQAGEAVANAGEMLAKRADQENTSDVTAKLTKANADLALDLQNTIRTAEPGDKKAFEDYQQRVDDKLSEVGAEASSLSARKFYEEASVRIKGSLTQTAAAGHAELAGIKAVNDYGETVNNLSAAVMADPSSMMLQRDLHRAAINNLVETGQLPREKALQLEKQGDLAITKATVRGWIELNPDYAKEKLKRGEFDSILGAEGKVQMFGEVEQAVRAKEVEVERRERQKERLAKQQQQITQNDFLAAMQEGKLDAKSILNSNLEAFGSGSKEQFLNMLKIANAPEQKLKTDPGTMIELFNRIHLPDGDPQKLTDENELNNYFGRGLSLTDVNHLRDEMQGKQTEAGKIENDMRQRVMDIAKGKLTKSNPLTGFRDPMGDEQYAKFMVYFMNEYKTQRAAGKSAVALLDPSSQDYLGKMISSYTRTNQQIMRDLAPKRSAPAGGGLALTPQPEPAAAGGAPAAPLYRAPAPPKASPRQPGESAQDYLKRIKAGG